MLKTTSKDHTTTSTAITIRATSAQKAKELGGTAGAKVSSAAAINNDKSHTTLLGNGTKVRGQITPVAVASRTANYTTVRDVVYSLPPPSRPWWYAADGLIM